MKTGLEILNVLREAEEALTGIRFDVVNSKLIHSEVVDIKNKAQEVSAQAREIEFSCREALHGGKVPYRRVKQEDQVEQAISRLVE